ncbi:OLC1v1022353C1 [Oldenlandia corymbosa var. corymbosa]|uniref:OLC1v1022353C1 n=1 Tax=Oldenlandia corymbosa var. corymbosa TaxID=529605 RepID=A0AAV1C0G5_OLDCO|nr:OLC1v1022353C1 [Oldenlandia corymbosa var. corymbosa]
MVEDKEDQLDSMVKTKRSSLFGGDIHGKDQSAGKLCIKLKFPKEEEEDDEDENTHNMMTGNTNSWAEEEEEVAEEESPAKQNQNNTEDNATAAAAAATVTLARICQVCGKGFKSGKALGGHMRVHFQPNKDLIFTTKKLNQQQPLMIKKLKKPKREKRPEFFVNKKPTYYYYSSYKSSQSELDGLDHEDYPCSICGKNFPSMKSLSGHMRCHPEREWRGIQPPSFSPLSSVHNNNNKLGSPSSSVSDPDQPQYSSNDEDDDDDDDDDDDMHVVDDPEKGDETDDLSKSLGNCWSVTAKRGRKAIFDMKGKEEAADEDDDEQGIKERNAIFQLMSLARGGFFEADNNNNQKVVKDGFGSANSNHEGIDMRRVVSVDESKKKKRRRIRHHPVEELNRTEDDSKKRKSDVGSGIGIGTGMIEDHKGHVIKKGVQRTDFLAGGKNLEMDINWPNDQCAAEKKDFWGDEDADDDSEKTLDNQQLMNLQHLKQSGSITSNGNLIMGVQSKKKKKKKMKLRDLESVHHHHDYDHNLPTPSTAALTVQPKGNSSSSPELLEKFRCTTCDKCFSTHQALGGHRSGHNKSRMLIENALDHYESTAAAGEHEDDDHEDDENPTMEGIKKLSGDGQHEESAGSNRSKSKGPVVAEESGGDGSEQDHHLCEICNKQFPSGQALGGHKRCHWSNNNAARIQVASPAGFEGPAVSHTDHAKAVGFDLNEEPPMEDADYDDVRGTNGCGYATSNSIEFPFF